MAMNAETIERLFRTQTGSYAFARWNRPIAPVVFGIGDASIPIIKGAVEAVATLAGVGVQGTDPEIGSNFMMFFFREWAELTQTPDLDRLVPDLSGVVDRLEKSDASQYRFFRYDPKGGIQAVFIFVRMSGAMAELPAETIALTQAVQGILTWGGGAFSETSPLAVHPETKAVVLRPEIADLIRAAYDPVMPLAAGDASHALRLSARIGG